MLLLCRATGGGRTLENGSDGVASVAPAIDPTMAGLAADEQPRMQQRRDAGSDAAAARSLPLETDSGGGDDAGSGEARSSRAASPRPGSAAAGTAAAADGVGGRAPRLDAPCGLPPCLRQHVPRTGS